MWSVAFGIIRGLIDAFHSWQVSQQRALDRKAGADDLSTQISAGVLKRAKEARAIESADNGDEWLRPPSKRTPNSE